MRRQNDLEEQVRARTARGAMLTYLQSAATALQLDAAKENMTHIQHMNDSLVSQLEAVTQDFNHNEKVCTRRIVV